MNSHSALRQETRMQVLLFSCDLIFFFSISACNHVGIIKIELYRFLKFPFNLHFLKVLVCCLDREEKECMIPFAGSYPKYLNSPTENKSRSQKCSPHVQCECLKKKETCFIHLKGRVTESERQRAKGLPLTGSLSK